MNARRRATRPAGAAGGDTRIDSVPLVASPAARGTHQAACVHPARREVRIRCQVMHPARTFAVTLLGLVVFGSLLITGGYAWYLRSAGYRQSCAAMLSEQLGLPAEIGRILPKSRTAREFRDVRVYLPGRRGLAAAIDRALVRSSPTPDDPDAYEVNLLGGQSELSSRTWLASDYRTVLESGLRPGFQTGGPRRVVLRGIRLTIDHARFRATLDDASGYIEFDAHGHGSGVVQCHSFNGFSVETPVELRASFSQIGGATRLDTVELDVPPLPLTIFRLDQFTGLPTRHGRFTGRVEYHEDDGGRRTLVTGELTDVHLDELTSGLLDPPWTGTGTRLTVEELALRDRRLERLRLHGRMSDVALGPLLATVGLPNLGGKIDLDVATAELAPAGIVRLSLAGRCEALSLSAASAILGWGSVTGSARLNLRDLTVADNRLISLEARAEVAPDGDAPGTIERSLLDEIVRRTLGFALPPVLPERIEYTQLGVRIEVRDEVLSIFGTHGDGERVILTARVLGRDVPIVFEPPQPIDLTPTLDALRAEWLPQVARWVDALADGVPLTASPVAPPTLTDAPPTGPE